MMKLVDLQFDFLTGFMIVVMNLFYFHRQKDEFIFITYRYGNSEIERDKL